MKKNPRMFRNKLLKLACSVPLLAYRRQTNMKKKKKNERKKKTLIALHSEIFTNV